MAAHKHCELMKQYAEDAAETDTPHERWEVRHPATDLWASGLWRPLLSAPTWYVGDEYRRKPRTLTYTVTIPEPLRKPPVYGSKYWVPSLVHSDRVIHAQWGDCATDRRILAEGLCYASQEDAAAAAIEMLPFWGAND